MSCGFLPALRWFFKGEIEREREREISNRRSFRFVSVCRPKVILCTFENPRILFRATDSSSSNFHQFPVLVGNAYSAEKFGPFQIFPGFVSSTAPGLVAFPCVIFGKLSKKPSFRSKSTSHLAPWPRVAGTADWADVFLLSHISHLGSCFELLQISHEAHDFCIP